MAAERPNGMEAGGRWVSITVTDSGPGIPPEHREAVFERFRQLDGGASRRTSGTGLGLAIVKDFVELHGGRILVDQAPEGGASFTVELPRQAPAGAQVRAATAEADQAAAEAARAAVEELRVRVEVVPSVRQTKGKALVLVVEDNPDMNRFICDTLASEFRTEAAFDGHEGLRKAIELHPDLVLTDVMMPGKSGDQLTRDLRARAELDRVPIVLLTSKADEELRIQLLREGAQDYLTKPFSAEELRVRVGNLVTLKRAQDVLLEAKTAAESANQELQAFSYSVSHDLRAPLRGMAGFSRALLEDYSDLLDVKGRDYLKRIQAASQRMGEIIDGLLQLSRVSRKDVGREHINLSELARSVAEDVGRGEPDRRVEVIVASDLMAYGDARLVQLVLQNLVGNAWKFTRRTEGARIEIGSAERAGHTAFFVRDNGAGFDMQHAGKLFAPFQRLHRSEEFPGIGIGLATVHRIITRHGGRVWAESAPGAGATFWFTLPSIAEIRAA
jgi:signal transduction histidine kinase